MKLNDTYKAIILFLVGVLVLVFSIMYITKPNLDSIKALKDESVQLQQRLTELQAKQAKREDYLAKTVEYEEEFNRILNAFPADLNQEITIMFMQGIKDNNEFSIGSLGLGQKNAFYTLGLNGGDAALGATTTDVPATEGTTEEAVPDDLATTDNAQYVCYEADFPISYEGSYQSLKDVIQYVNTYSDRMTVNTLNISYNAQENVYQGSMTLSCYSIESSERPERTLELNEVEIGVDNIFTGSGTGSSSESSSLNKYDENDGAAIESSYDFYAMLNPADSDVSAKVVGQNGSGKEASVVSNSDNSTSTLSFEFYEKDGKNYCKYTLDSVEYEAEVTAAEDIKLLIQSSARKSDDDKVAVRVTIKNSTKLPVYVKVSGEDATSPRINIANTTGSVKVYK